MMKWVKKFLKFLFWGVATFSLLVLVNLFLDKWFLPKLLESPLFKKFTFLQNFDEKTTIINRTEQVIVKEEKAFSFPIEKVSSAVVRIVSFLPNSNNKDKNDFLISQDYRLDSRAGIILTSDGLVVSWVDQATGDYLQQNKNIQYKIMFSDQSVLAASFLGYDSYSQLVFYKIEKSGNWTVPVLGESNKILAGDKVGMVSLSEGGTLEVSKETLRLQANDFSLLNSNLASSEKIEGVWLFSSQAIIDKKNVGSPVINSDGEVVGITGLVEKNGQAEGLILPMRSIRKTIDSFINNDFVKRSFFGVYYLPINQALALRGKLSVSEGALVYSFSGQQGLAVLKGSPADMAGIKLGDIVLEVDDEKITRENSFSKLLSEKKPGEKVKIKLLRDNKEHEVIVTLE